MKLSGCFFLTGFRENMFVKNPTECFYYPASIDINSFHSWWCQFSQSIIPCENDLQGDTLGSYKYPHPQTKRFVLNRLTTFSDSKTVEQKKPKKPLYLFIISIRAMARKMLETEDWIVLFPHPLPKFIWQSFNPQDAITWVCGLWEGVRVTWGHGVGSPGWGSALTRRDR